MAVGRIDFARMPIFANPPPGIASKSETDLLRQYLNKDHRYRHRQFTLPQRGIADSYFGSGDNDAVYQNSVRSCSVCFGFPGQIIDRDLFTSRIPCVWGSQGGYGAVNAINVATGTTNTHSSTDLTNPTNEPPILIYLLKGSFFGDWNLAPDDFLRACLATTNYGLASMWFRSTTWRLETMALGETLADGLLRTANDTSQFPFGGLRSLAIMGDPTLRLHVVVPVSNLTATNTGTVTLSWSPSPDPGASYFVYRSTNSFDGPFAKLTSAPISATSYVDTSPPTATKTYQVRALSLVISASGSYTNLSQGMFITVN